MSLQVIGAGFGRTGTLSLKTALGQLGYPCYHMMDLLFAPAHKADVDFWLEVAENPDYADRDWDRVFARHSATVDNPSCAVWRALVAAHPQAKVVLTLHPRGAEAWYDSTAATIYAGTDQTSRTAFGQKINTMMDRLVWKGLLQGAMEDRDRAIARYHAHIEEVRAGVPADRLLVFSVDQGWAPLCEFLGCPVPDAPFPNVNEREQMARLTARLKRMQSFGQRKPGTA